MRAQYQADHPAPAALVYDDVLPDEAERDDHPSGDDAPAAHKKRDHVKYDVRQAVATINKINELYPNEPPRKASTIYTMSSSIRTSFKKLGVGDDLYRVLQYPKKVITKMQGFVDRRETPLSTSTTQHTQILLLMDHLPEYRRHARALKEYGIQANLEKKTTVEFDIMRFPAYVQKIDAAHGTDSLQSLLAHMFHEVPVRDDFHAQRIVDVIKDATDKHENYLVMPRGAASIVVNAYETDGKYAATQLPS